LCLLQVIKICDEIILRRPTLMVVIVFACVKFLAATICYRAIIQDICMCSHHCVVHGSYAYALCPCVQFGREAKRTL
jgi:hypothetical protein